MSDTSSTIGSSGYNYTPPPNAFGNASQIKVEVTVYDDAGEAVRNAHPQAQPANVPNANADRSTLGRAWDGFVGGLNSAWNSAADKVANVGRGIENKFALVGNGIASVARTAWNAAASLMSRDQEPQPQAHQLRPVDAAQAIVVAARDYGDDMLVSTLANLGNNVQFDDATGHVRQGSLPGIGGDGRKDLMSDELLGRLKNVANIIRDDPTNSRGLNAILDKIIGAPTVHDEAMQQLDDQIETVFIDGGDRSTFMRSQEVYGRQLRVLRQGGLDNSELAQNAQTSALTGYSNEIEQAKADIGTRIAQLRDGPFEGTKAERDQAISELETKFSLNSISGPEATLVSSIVRDMLRALYDPNGSHYLGNAIGEDLDAFVGESFDRIYAAGLNDADTHDALRLLLTNNFVLRGVGAALAMGADAKAMRAEGGLASDILSTVQKTFMRVIMDTAPTSVNAGMRQEYQQLQQDFQQLRTNFLAAAGLPQLHEIPEQRLQSSYNQPLALEENRNDALNAFMAQETGPNGGQQPGPAAPPQQVFVDNQTDSTLRDAPPLP